MLSYDLVRNPQNQVADKDDADSAEKEMFAKSEVKPTLDT